MQRSLVEGLMSAGALLALILTLAAVNGQVREQISMRVTGPRASANFAEAEATVRHLSSEVYVAVRDVSMDHTPLVMFAVAGTVLLLFMLRT